MGESTPTIYKRCYTVHNASDQLPSPSPLLFLLCVCVCMSVRERAFDGIHVMRSFLLPGCQKNTRTHSQPTHQSIIFTIRMSTAKV